LAALNQQCVALPQQAFPLFVLAAEMDLGSCLLCFNENKKYANVGKKFKTFRLIWQLIHAMSIISLTIVKTCPDYLERQVESSTTLEFIPRKSRCGSFFHKFFQSIMVVSRRLQVLFALELLATYLDAAARLECTVLLATNATNVRCTAWLRRRGKTSKTNRYTSQQDQPRKHGDYDNFGRRTPGLPGGCKKTEGNKPKG